MNVSPRTAAGRKNSKTVFAKKAVSITIIAVLAASLASCAAGTTESSSRVDDRISMTTRTTESEMLETGMSEPNQTIDPVRITTETPSETPAEPTKTVPQGTYPYILYKGTPQQTTICMDYDIQPGTRYLQKHKNPTAYYYEIDSLASSLGWKLNGSYSIEETNEDTDPTYFYTYDYGDYLVLLEVEESTDIVYSKAWVQIEAVRISYIRKDDLDTPYFDDSVPDHEDLVIAFGNHLSAIEYPGLGTRWAFSYNDYVLMTYLFWLLPELGEAKTDTVYNILLPAAVSTGIDEDNSRVLNLQ